MTAVPTCLRICGMIKVALGTDFCGGFVTVRANGLPFFPGNLGLWTTTH